jgi:hypothetical protein
MIERMQRSLNPVYKIQICNRLIVRTCGGRRSRRHVLVKTCNWTRETTKTNRFGNSTVNLGHKASLRPTRRRSCLNRHWQAFYKMTKHRTKFFNISGLQKVFPLHKFNEPPGNRHDLSRSSRFNSYLSHGEDTKDEITSCFYILPLTLLGESHTVYY